ncbi:MAG: OsmC family protein, partial [Acidobacteriota bacterium]|nr:OsmC family protein [Acidobacteriota bacterium]
RTAFERSAKAISLRPTVGRHTATSRITVRDGVRCEIEDGRWKLVSDLGDDSGGEGKGPAPGVYARAALGSCLGLAIAHWSAKLGVPIDDLEIDVESDADAAGVYGVAEVPPGYSQVRCTVTIRSGAPETCVRDLVDQATERCLVWDVFARAVEMRRELRIVATEG